MQLSLLLPEGTMRTEAAFNPTQEWRDRFVAKGEAILGKTFMDDHFSWANKAAFYIYLPEDDRRAQNVTEIPMAYLATFFNEAGEKYRRQFVDVLAHSMAGMVGTEGVKLSKSFSTSLVNMKDGLTYRFRYNIAGIG